jgi:hypothetical protein
MATIVLSKVGGLVGGQIGSVIGALVGQQVDAELFGPGPIEGPRISDLAITTSSYGQAIPRQFGTMRVAGSIIWSTDLIETSETSSNGKGQPKSKTYSYSISFAVALSSRPIASVGRIWADGNLLRGAAGDLKTPGEMRTYLGHGDQLVDPLISSAVGPQCPAFRDIAYVVFEDLHLGDFGNRIPALTFEVMADDVPQLELSDMVPFASVDAGSDSISAISGYSDRGGALQSSLGVLSRVFPLTCKTGENAVEIGLRSYDLAEALPLPAPIVSAEDRSGNVEARHSVRAAAGKSAPKALRYFDVDRDYQTSVQRAIGRAHQGREIMLELPAAMEASAARDIASHHSMASAWQGERLQWTIAELDPAFTPGAIVGLPERAGAWSIEEWNWTDQGIELVLERVSPFSANDLITGVPGDSNGPVDELPWPSIIDAFELPWDGIGSSALPQIFAAVTAEGANWSGANLYLEQQDALTPIETASRRRAVVGTLVGDLGASAALTLEGSASIEIDLVGADLAFSSTTIASLANGTNRLKVGDEVLQFLNAEKIAATRWKLSGLLRGRGGTEHAALSGHTAGSGVILIDDRLTVLDPNQTPSSQATGIAAIGFGDEDPVVSQITSAGQSLAPLSPVHTAMYIQSDASWNLCWTRRARGQWRWLDSVAVPLIEEQESYLVGIGPTADPSVSWTVADTSLVIASASASNLLANHSGQPIWVKQIGTFSQSPATLIATIS